jgi:hypothetical protein
VADVQAVEPLHPVQHLPRAARRGSTDWGSVALSLCATARSHFIPDSLATAPPPRHLLQPAPRARLVDTAVFRDCPAGPGTAGFGR